MIPWVYGLGVYGINITYCWDNKWRVVSATNIANISIPLHSLINTASVFTADYAMRTYSCNCKCINLEGMK